MKPNIPPKVMEEATPIIAALESGIHWSQEGGYKLRGNKGMIGFELRQFYRILCYYKNNVLLHCEVLSHEEYSKRTSQNFR